MPHEWEQLDQGIAHCIKCPATSVDDVECMSESTDQKLTPAPQPPPQPKESAGGKVEWRTEVQNIQRIVNGANKRLERLCESLERFNEQVNIAQK